MFLIRDNKKELTVVTNGLNVCAELVHTSGVEVILGKQIEIFGRSRACDLVDGSSVLREVWGALVQIVAV